MSREEKKDHWSTETYNTSASFVAQLTEKVLKYLNPQPTDRILDIGCGDGVFTAKFANEVAYVLGVDASRAMIQSASESFGQQGKVDFQILDCTELEEENIHSKGFDKVVSNAALHWILRNESTRLSTLRGIHAALKSGGSFVFEMGGHGNIGEMHAALLMGLVRHGLSVEQAMAASPWFFPSDVWMRSTLEDVGFRVEVMELEHRPTKLTAVKGGGMEGWVRLMGAQMIEALPESERESFVKEVCAVLGPVMTRVEDGSQWLGYVRLRGLAVKI